MNADFLSTYQLEDRYDLAKNRIYINGVQTFLRMALAQRAADQQLGINSGGFISGYRGSPVGGVDLEAWREAARLHQHGVVFQPSINEDLAATAIWGTQLTDYYRQTSTKQGVFAYWYGKGHGVDRSADVFRQANIQGTAEHGGVLVIAGDDHNAESSVFAHQTDQIFTATLMPLLFPSSIEEYVQYGLAGIAMSRFCGLWIGFKAVTEVIESAGSITQLPVPSFLCPEISKPPHGLNFDPHLKWPSQRGEYERRVLEERIPAAQAFAYTNNLDVILAKAQAGGLGIVTAGKSYIDLLQALADVGLSQLDLERAGVGVLKVGMIWPLEPRRIREFARGLDTLLVIEEKRAFLESQVKTELYGLVAGERPSVVGKTLQDGRILLPESSALTSAAVIKAMVTVMPLNPLRDRMQAYIQSLNAATSPNVRSNTELPARTPYFCAGCPHNRSTEVPCGSFAGAGIGCHIMAVGTGRRTETFTQMGGEGVHWVGLSSFNDSNHMFQNLGDGTYQHSGSLAVRQAVLSGVNLTFKILYNDAVAMTGGQPVEGQPSVGRIARQLLAEGVVEVVVLSDDPATLRSTEDLPENVQLHPRDALDSVQCRLREIDGVTALIYVQTCAAEKRRRRKRGSMVDPQRRLFINEDVCEGCGDCTQQSGCIAIEPLPSPRGRKRQINQSSCNKDFSCLNGFCPSFVEVVGGELSKAPTQPRQALLRERSAALSMPEIAELQNVYSILCAGIGGSGVLTLAGVVAMAAHLQGYRARTLDFTGLSQKNGSVVGHIKIAPQNVDIHSPRIDQSQGDVLLGCDQITAASFASLMAVESGKVLLNSGFTPTAQFVADNDMPLVTDVAPLAFERFCYQRFDANAAARQLFGDSAMVNMLVLGFAFQHGWIPLPEPSLRRAIELNGVSVQDNLEAFTWGRILAEDQHAVRGLIPAQALEIKPSPKDWQQELMDELRRYQNEAYAQSFSKFCIDAQHIECAQDVDSEQLVARAARHLARLMMYKDEYEVARLYSSDAFRNNLRAQFSGGYKLRVHLAPPLISRIDRHSGRPRKRAYGQWVFGLFHLLARFRGLRGTLFDPFGYLPERRQERQLVNQYRDLVKQVLRHLRDDNTDQARALIDSVDDVRGFGVVKQQRLNAYYERIDRDLPRYLAG